MANDHGVFYDETHSVSFGKLNSGVFYENANTWSDWHLIPSSKFYVPVPTVTPKLVTIPGSDDPIDLTTYLTGSSWPIKGQRSGSLSFIMDTNDETAESIYSKMNLLLHGKRVNMVFNDDPNYCYEGRFTVGDLTIGSGNPTVSIEYALDPNAVVL